MELGKQKELNIYALLDNLEPITHQLGGFMLW